MRGFLSGIDARIPLILLVLAMAATACGRSEPVEEAAHDPHHELRERFDLAADREIHRVTIGGRGSREHLVPPLLTVRPGAIVEFVPVDGRVHTIRFAADSLPLDARLFLQRTSQLESPPLVDRSSRFVLTFDGAPEGRYGYLVEGPGGAARGVVVVEEEP